MENSGPSLDMRSNFNDELNAEFAVAPQDTYTLSAAAYPPYESHISDHSLYDDILMNLDDIGDSPSSALKRKPNTLDFDRPSPLSILDPSSAMGPPPGKKARQDPSANSDRPFAQLDPGKNSGDSGVETQASPSQGSRSDVERTDVVPDIESSIEAILNELAEEESRRQESEQEKYVSSLFGAASDSSAQSYFANSATDFVLPSDTDSSSDELLQNLFDRLQTLSLGDGSFDSQREPDVNGGITEENFPNHTGRSFPPADVSPYFPLPGGPLSFLYEERNDVESSDVTDPRSFSGTTLWNGHGFDVLPPTAADSASSRVKIPTLEADGGVELDDEEMSLPGKPLDSGIDEPDHDAFPEAGISHCPCNQCSPRPPTQPDQPSPSQYSQHEIHRLFLLSPFARPTNSMR
ncbi:hypothetical protein C8R45DRAFT_1030587 [Mycena sanguinolenta]|nr:hypothetical protein C8R45DRAFT_1030587 [Mycena sanguinolenta]